VWICFLFFVFIIDFFIKFLLIIFDAFFIFFFYEKENKVVWIYFKLIRKLFFISNLTEEILKFQKIKIVVFNNVTEAIEFIDGFVYELLDHIIVRLDFYIFALTDYYYIWRNRWRDKRYYFSFYIWRYFGKIVRILTILKFFKIWKLQQSAWVKIKRKFKRKRSLKVSKIYNRVTDKHYKKKSSLISQFKKSRTKLKFYYLFSKIKMHFNFWKYSIKFWISWYKCAIVNIILYTYLALFRFLLLILWILKNIVLALYFFYREYIYDNYTIFWALYLRKIKTEIRYSTAWFKSKK
jgi:hypothetical protein